MVRLTILGDIDLRTGDDVVIGSVLSQPSRFALLVYLALEGKDGGVSRDRLLGVFWPEVPEARGRQSLRTALHFLRRSLGPGTLVNRGGLVVLAEDRIACDAVELMDALAAGDGQRALQLYGGGLLPGFHVDGGSVALERWLEDTRTTLRREAAEAAWSLAEVEERAGNAAGAGAWARRAAALWSEDEAAARRAMDLLGRVGDRAGALDLYRTLARRLEELDASPSAETERVLERVRGGGPNPVVDPLSRPEEPPTGGEGPAPDDATRSPPPVPSPTGARRSAEARANGGLGKRRPWRQVASAVGSVVLMIAFYSLWGLDRAERGWIAPPASPTLQFEEFQDFSLDGGTAGLAGALSTELAGRLSGVDRLVVRLAAVVGAPSPAGPSYALRGGVLRSDSIVRVTATLLDAESGAALHRISAEEPVGSDDPSSETVDRLAEELAREVRSRIGRAVDDRERRLAADDPRALSLVTTAVREVEVSDSLRDASSREAAEVALLAADSQLAEAQAAAPRWGEPSVQRAEVAFRRMWLHVLPGGDRRVAAGAIHDGVDHAETALAISNEDAGALELRGTLEYWTWLLRAGGSDSANREALQRAEADLIRATRLDAGLARGWATLSAIRETRGDFAGANLAARKAYRADAFLGHTSEILLRLFRTSLEVGDLAAAGEWCEKLGLRMPGSWLAAYCALEHLAWQESPAVDETFVRAAIDSAMAGSAAARALRPRFEMLGAVVLARAGRVGPALATVERVAGEASTEPELLELEAWARLTLGQIDAAETSLRAAIASNEGVAGSVLASRRFAELRHRITSESAGDDGT